MIKRRQDFFGEKKRWTHRRDIDYTAIALTNQCMDTRLIDSRRRSSLPTQPPSYSRYSLASNLSC
jgi:hypothetical protein